MPRRQPLNRKPQPKLNPKPHATLQAERPLHSPSVVGDFGHVVHLGPKSIHFRDNAEFHAFLKRAEWIGLRGQCDQSGLHGSSAEQQQQQQQQHVLAFDLGDTRPEGTDVKEHKADKKHNIAIDHVHNRNHNRNHLLYHGIPAEPASNDIGHFILVVVAATLIALLFVGWSIAPQISTT